MVALTVLCGFLNGCVFHHPVCFVCLVGVFSVIPSCLIWSAPLWSLHQWRDCIHLLLRSASSELLALHVLVDPWSSGMCYLPVEFHGVLNRSVPSALIWTGCFSSPSLLRHPLWRTCWVHIYRPLFLKVDGLLVLIWRSCFTSDCLTRCVGRIPIRLPPSYLWGTAVAGPVVAQCWRRRRDEIFLAIV